MYFITGEGDEKGKVMGIFRSLGALARALGPTVACAGNVCCVNVALKKVHHNISWPFIMQGCAHSGWY